MHRCAGRIKCQLGVKLRRLQAPQHLRKRKVFLSGWFLCSTSPINKTFIFEAETQILACSASAMPTNTRSLPSEYVPTTTSVRGFRLFRGLGSIGHHAGHGGMLCPTAPEMLLRNLDSQLDHVIL